MNINKNNYEAFLLDYIEGNLSAEQAAELMLFLEQHPEIDPEIEDFKIIAVNKEKAVFDSKNNLKRKEFVVNDDLIEGLIISYVNGDLSKAEETKLLKIVNENLDYKILLSQYQFTKLQSGNEKITDKVLLKGHLPVTADNVEYFIIAETEGVLTADEKKSLDNYRSAFPGIKELSVAYAGTKLNAQEKFVFENKSSLKKKEGVVISMWMRYASVAAAACLLLYFAFFTGSTENTTAPVAEEKNNTIKENKQNNIVEEKPSPSENIEEESLENLDLSPSSTNENNLANNIKNEKPNQNKSFEPKEPVLDGGFADDIQYPDRNNENTMYARVEIEPLKNDDNNTLFANNNVSSLNEDDFITPGQYVRNWAKKTFFTEVAEEKFNNNETAELASNSTLQLKGTNSTISNKEGKNFKEYGFSIGKFSFQRRVKK